MPNKSQGPQLRNRLGIILAEMAHEGKAVDQKEIAQATGVAESTISRIVNNRTDRFEGRVIAAICRFLDIPIAEFFEIVPAEESEEGQLMAVALSA